MTQPKHSASVSNQHAVKEHVKAMLRKIPRKTERQRGHRYQAAA